MLTPGLVGVSKKIKGTDKDLGGTMRLGLYDCNILDGTKTKEIYKSNLISERHRHRYEVNNKFVNEFKKLARALSLSLTTTSP